ncbi:MAG: tRNA 4-thiouridine(8) synthase ThiI [Clostridiales bacterium]|nr:tRNA 4-thiouridine(8) synthase ThiI [Clostridiales bacterium]
MNKVILLRIGELYLKGKNKGFFEKTLLKNIKKVLMPFDCNVVKISGRYLVRDFDEMDYNQIINKLAKVFGLTSLSLATEFDTSKENIENFLKEFKTNAKTFRVSVKRADKTFPVASNEYERYLGGIVLSANNHLKVKLKDAELELVVDIRENGKTYVLTESIPCACGMPTGTSGRGLVLLSGGIDSPVSAYMMAKRGLELVGLHFHSFPYTSAQAKEKVCKLAKILTDYTMELKLICCPFTEIQEEIHKNCAPEFMITIMRRIMMRIAKIVCDKYYAKAIITGESLAQVASQTIESINVTNDAQSTYPVFRPCIGMDKSEIIEISRKIGTFETSILPYEDCCTVFLPKNPVIKPNLEKVLKEEAKLDIDLLIEKAISKLEIIEI